jgi:hypothetical protein
LNKLPGWIELPDSPYAVSPRRLKSYGSDKMTNLQHFGERDEPPIQRMIRYSTLMAQRNGDGSFIPDNSQFTELIKKASAARKQDEMGDLDDLSGFYTILTSGLGYVTTEVLEFVEVKPGKGNLAILYRYDNNGVLIPVNENIIIPPAGWIREISDYGLPVETSKKLGGASMVGKPLEENAYVAGRFNIGINPRMGEKRLVVREPYNHDNRPLDMTVTEKLFCDSSMMTALLMREKK